MEQALALARSYFDAQPAQPAWKWNVVDAVPDLEAVQARHRKTIVAWAVIVEWSHRGSVVDGPAILRVNIFTRQVAWL